MEHLTLVIDTACSWIAIGLFGPSTHISHAVHAPREAFNSLIPDIRSILADRKPSSIVCVTGPGSFTGIRIGVSCSRTLAQLWAVPAAGISSLASAAFAVSQTERRPFAVCIDGKQKRFYTLVVDSFRGAGAETAQYVNSLPVRDLTAEELGALQLPVYSDVEIASLAGIVRPSPRPDAAHHFAFYQLSGVQAASFHDLLPYYHRLDPAEQKFPGGIHKT